MNKTVVVENELSSVVEVAPSAKRQSGFTLIEILVVLAIGALLILGVGYGASRAISSQSTTEDVSNFQSAVTGIRKLCSVAGNTCAPLTTDVIAGNNVFPAERVLGAAPNRTIEHKLADSGTIGVAGALDTVTLTYSSPSSTSICSEFTQTVSKQASVITVGGQPVKAAGAAIDLAALGVQCANAARDIAITIRRN